MDNVEEMVLRFFGRVAAGFTHELKNVLAIVKETAGLMEDLLAMMPEGTFPQQPKFQRTVTTILEQVARGVDLSSKMNQFAHSPDQSLTQVDLNAMAAQVALLAERFARLKGVSLSTAAAERPVVILSCPVKILLCVFKGYECCWNHLASGSSALMTVRPTPQPALSMTWTGDTIGSPDLQSALEASSDWTELLQVMDSLHGKLYWGEPTGFTLEFPQQAPER
jgi:hypothetical protein